MTRRFPILNSLNRTVRLPWSRTVFVCLCLVAMAAAPRNGHGQTLTSDTETIGDAMRSALLGRPDPIRRLADTWAVQDDIRQDDKQAPLGLAGPMMALAAATAPDRDTQRRWAREALKRTDDRLNRERIRWALKSDPVDEFRRLRRYERWDLFARPFNSLIRAVAGVAWGRADALLQAPVDAVFAVPDYVGLNPRKRRAMQLADRIVAEGATDPRVSEQIRDQAMAYRRKVRRERMRADYDLARRLFQLERYRECVDLCDALLKDDGTWTGAYRLMVRADARLAEETRRRTSALSVAPHEPWAQAGGPPAAAYGRQLRALLLGDRAPARALLNEGLADPDDPVDPNAIRYALSALSDRDGAHAEAVRVLESIAREEGLGPASAWLTAPDYHFEYARRQARGKVRADRRRYIATGAPAGRENLYLLSSAGVKGSASGLANIAIINVFAVTFRAIRLIWQPAVSVAPIMDVLEKELRARPDSPQAAIIHEDYAERAIYMKDEDRARAEYEAAGLLTSERAAALTNRQARRAYTAIRSEPDLRKRLALYHEWLEAWGDTAAAARTRKALSRDQRKAGPYYQIARDDLYRYADRWRRLGAPPFAAHPEWFDGDKANGEIDKEGLGFNPVGRPDDPHSDWTVLMRVAGRDAFEIYTLTAPEFENLRAALEQYTGDTRALERLSDTRQTYYFPVNVQGGAGVGGFSLYPQLQRAPQLEDATLYKN